jgi:hypothetical protein
MDKHTKPNQGAGHFGQEDKAEESVQVVLDIITANDV